MLAIGLTLLLAPKLLLLDEPSSDLAPAMVDQVFAAIREIHRRLAIPDPAGRAERRQGAVARRPGLRPGARPRGARRAGRRDRYGAASRAVHRRQRADQLTQRRAAIAMTKTAEAAAPVRVGPPRARHPAGLPAQRALARPRRDRPAGAASTRRTARRLLMTLMGERLVEQDPSTKAYSLGLGVLELAAGLTPCDDLRQRAKPVLAAIAESTGATAFLGVVHDGAALVHRPGRWRRGDPDPRLVGRRQMPLNCGAGPRVLMAHRPARGDRAHPGAAARGADPLHPGRRGGAFGGARPHPPARLGARRQRRRRGHQQRRHPGA